MGRWGLGVGQLGVLEFQWLIFFEFEVGFSVLIWC
jgi:hypothetical protein